jgi:hypothetical protein
MSPKISLSEFVAALQFGDATAVHVLDTQTGRIVPRRDSDEQVAEPTQTGDTRPSTDYESLPTFTDQEELAFARQFVATVKDPHDRRRLELALASGNAREAFEMAVFRCQIANEWYQYRDQCLEQFAKDWLDARGLSYTDDVSRPAE